MTRAPARDSVIRLVAAVLTEQHDEWAEQRRYLGVEALAAAQTVLTARTTEQSKEDTTSIEPTTAGELTRLNHNRRVHILIDSQGLDHRGARA